MKFLKFVLKGTTEGFNKLIKMRFFVSKRFVNIIFTDGNTKIKGRKFVVKDQDI